MARPEQWARWAPHVRGGRGLGEPEVRAGARGAAMLLGVLPVPARILGKEAGRSWSWLVGPLTIEHRVEPIEHGCEIVFEAGAARDLRVVTALYAPVMHLMAARLARRAEEDEAREYGPAEPRNHEQQAALPVRAGSGSG